MPYLKHLTFLLLLSFNAGFSLGQQNLRFRIFENNRVGYIDQTGKVVIEPVYLNGAAFSEGLAAVRINGKYGFIDSYGKMIIPPKYDFAESFKFGLACVYVDGEVQIIDKNDKCIFKNPAFKNVRLISQNLAKAETTKKKYQLIDIRAGKPLLKHHFEQIHEFQDGVAVVLTSNKRESTYAVIDTNGRFIVRLGVYSEIKDFVDGYALIEGYQGKEDFFEGAIDTKGRLLFKRLSGGKSYLFDNFHDGLAVVNFQNYWDEERKEFSEQKKEYQGYINLKGEVVLNNPQNNYLNDFSEGRVFIKNNERNYQLFDTDFKLVTDELFNDFVKPGFDHGLAIVNKKGLWSLIDTAGNYLFEPKFESIVGMDYEHRLLIYGWKKEKSGPVFYGIANFKGEPVGEAKMYYDTWNWKLFENGLLLTILDKRLTYLNTSGEIVWQEQPTQPGKIACVNTEYMISGYFTAFSDDDEEDLGGFGLSSYNSVYQITDKHPFESNKLSILVDSSNSEIFKRRYAGLKVYVANNSLDTLRFDAQDSRLYMNVQAKDQTGKWRDIEHLPGSWCGNSYHILKLKPNEYWDFVTPVYEGEYKTQLRIKLLVRSKNGISVKKSEQIIYSNEYNGSVNPGQFWNKDHHVPSGIMDPYSY